MDSAHCAHVSLSYISFELLVLSMQAAHTQPPSGEVLGIEGRFVRQKERDQRILFGVDMKCSREKELEEEGNGVWADLTY